MSQLREHIPIGSMYGIFTYLWLISMVNYISHTLWGSVWKDPLKASSGGVRGFKHLSSQGTWKTRVTSTASRTCSWAVWKNPKDSMEQNEMQGKSHGVHMVGVDFGILFIANAESKSLPLLITLPWKLSSLPTTIFQGTFYPLVN